MINIYLTNFHQLMALGQNGHPGHFAQTSVAQTFSRTEPGSVTVRNPNTEDWIVTEMILNQDLVRGDNVTVRTFRLKGTAVLIIGIFQK